VLQGIVGTTAGTLWYVNWSERASIRLVSGHHSRVRSACFLLKFDILLCLSTCKYIMVAEMLCGKDLLMWLCILLPYSLACM